MDQVPRDVWNLVEKYCKTYEIIDMESDKYVTKYTSESEFKSKCMDVFDSFIDYFDKDVRDIIDFNNIHDRELYLFYKEHEILSLNVKNNSPLIDMGLYPDDVDDYAFGINRDLKLSLNETFILLLLSFPYHFIYEEGYIIVTRGRNDLICIIKGLDINIDLEIKNFKNKYIFQASDHYPILTLRQ